MIENIDQKQKTKIVVLDANFYWTEQMFSACREFADVLLLRPVDFRSFKKRYGRYFIDFQPRSLSPGVWEQRICCPPGWLFYYWPMTQYFLTKIIRQFQKNEPLIFVFSYPYYYSVIKKLKAHSIYYSIDNYQYYWPGREEQTKAMEKLAIAEADLILCVAQYRANLLKQQNPSKIEQIIHLAHGCSPQFMVNQALKKPIELPQSLKKYSRPIAGYIGTLSSRFDFTYLAKIAQQLPDITFILGGQIPELNEGCREWRDGLAKAKKSPNIHFIGHVPHHLLGEYLQSFDLLLMIYSRCDFNLNACPTKLWDYLGTSLPIVANNVVPEVNQWSELILVVQSPEDFVSKIRFALTNPQVCSQERLEMAKAHTWEKQSQKLYKLLSEKGWLTNRK